MEFTSHKHIIIIIIIYNYNIISEYNYKFFDEKELNP